MGVTISTSASSHNQGPQALPSPQPNEAWDSQCNPKSYYLTFFECKNKTFLLDNKILFALHPICWWAPSGLCCTGLSLHGRSTHKHSNQTKSVILKFWSLESAKWNCYGKFRQIPWTILVSKKANVARIKWVTPSQSGKCWWSKQKTLFTGQLHNTQSHTQRQKHRPMLFVTNTNLDLDTDCVCFVRK